MNKTLLGSAVLVTFLGLFIRQGLGIRCWECNSSFDPRCGETHFDPSTLDTVDCNQLKQNHLIGAEAIYCRKIVQRIETEVRTVRGCGWVEEKKAPVGSCYTRTGTKDVMVTYCHCNEDNCNSGNSVMSCLGLATALLILIKLF
nr:uncharacterized protein LOC123763680 [Procambarus clarkii]